MQLLLAGILTGRRGHGTPPSAAAAAGAPGLDRGEVVQGAGTLFPGQHQQARQQLGGNQRVTSSPMPGLVMEAEEPAQVVQPAGTHALHQPSREPDSTEPGASQ